MDPGGAGEGVGAPVKRVPGHRATGGGGVNADLVGASGEKFELQKAGAGPGADDFPVRAGGAALGPHRHFLAMDGVPADRALPGSDLSLGASENQGEVGLLGFPVLELAAEFPVGGVRLGRHEDAGGFQVQPVDDAGAVGSASGGELAGAVVEQGGGQGARGATGTRVDGQTGRFVQNDDIGVLVQDVQRDGFGFDVSRRGGGNPEGDGGAGGEEITGLDRPAGNFDQSGFHPLLDFAARLTAQPGHDKIGPFVCVRRADGSAPDPALGRLGFSASLLGMTGHDLLILPFFCSWVYAIGALLLKRSLEASHSPRQAMVACNLALALFSLPLLFWAQPPPPGLPLWVWLAAPACSALFFLGQIATFRALSGGDVSVATPIFGTKVVITALFGALFLPGGVAPNLWVAAMLGTMGVALVGMQPGVRRGKALRTVGWGLGSAAVFSLTDVLVARAAKEIGFCLFGPAMMVGMAALSVGVVPLAGWGGLVRGGAGRWALGGAALIGLQGSFLYASIALSGDPVGVNIVYALRGLWSVLLVVWIGKWVGSREAGLPQSVLIWRGLGALLLFAAVGVVVG